MAEARAKLAWGQTSLIACLIANANRDSKRSSKPFTPKDFDPFQQREESESEFQKIKDTIKGKGFKKSARPKGNKPIL